MGRFYLVTYQIAILAKMKFFPDENFAHNFQYYDPDNRVSLGPRVVANKGLKQTANMPAAKG